MKNLVKVSSLRPLKVFLLTNDVNVTKLVREQLTKSKILSLIEVSVSPETLQTAVKNLDPDLIIFDSNVEFDSTVRSKENQIVIKLNNEKKISGAFNTDELNVYTLPIDGISNLVDIIHNGNQLWWALACLEDI